jgi:taurine dioxygenase
MEFHKLHETLGAEVRGLDLLGPLSDAEVEDLRAALAEHQLLLFRVGRQMPPDRQVEVASWFGTPVGGHGQICSVLRNDNPSGAVVLKFHSDFTYTDSPLTGLCLHAIEVPRNGTTTTFLSGAHAWATLPADAQRQLASMTVRHVQDTSIMSEDLPVFFADQPVCLHHPVIKRPVLLVTEYHARQINELPAEESRDVLSRLFEHLYRPENIYVHDWRLHDLIVWDNLAIQHARPFRAAPEDGPRALQRVALGTIDYEDLVARARERARGGDGVAVQ